MADMSETNEGFLIHIKTITNEIHNFRMSSSTTVNELKAFMTASVNISEDRQRLIYRGRVLADGTTLSSYGIENGHTVQFVARPENYRELQQQAGAASVPPPPQTNETGTTARQQQVIIDLIMRDLISDSLNTRAQEVPSPPTMTQQFGGINPANVSTSMRSHEVGSLTNPTEMSENNGMEHIRQGLFTLNTILSTIDPNIATPEGTNTSPSVNTGGNNSYNNNDNSSSNSGSSSGQVQDRETNQSNSHAQPFSFNFDHLPTSSSEPLVPDSNSSSDATSNNNTRDSTLAATASDDDTPVSELLRLTNRDLVPDLLDPPEGGSASTVAAAAGVEGDEEPEPSVSVDEGVSAATEPQASGSDVVDSVGSVILAESASQHQPSPPLQVSEGVIIGSDNGGTGGNNEEDEDNGEEYQDDYEEDEDGGDNDNEEDDDDDNSPQHDDPTAASAPNPTTQSPSSSSVAQPQAQIPPRPVRGHLRAENGRFYTGQWIDVRDTVNQWLEATVMEIDSVGNRIFIHYNGWPDRWDEWLPFGSPRIAPFRSRTPHVPTVHPTFVSPAANTHIARRPVTGVEDIRTLLPEMARMLNILTPMVNEAAALAEQSLRDDALLGPMAAAVADRDRTTPGRSGNSRNARENRETNADLASQMVSGMPWHDLAHYLRHVLPDDMHGDVVVNNDSTSNSASVIVGREVDMSERARNASSNTMGRVPAAPISPGRSGDIWSPSEIPTLPAPRTQQRLPLRFTDSPTTPEMYGQFNTVMAEEDNATGTAAAIPPQLRSELNAAASFVINAEQQLEDLLTATPQVSSVSSVQITIRSDGSIAPVAVNNVTTSPAADVAPDVASNVALDVQAASRLEDRDQQSIGEASTSAQRSASSVESDSSVGGGIVARSTALSLSEYQNHVEQSALIVVSNSNTDTNTDSATRGGNDITEMYNEAQEETAISDLMEMLISSYDAEGNAVQLPTTRTATSSSSATSAPSAASSTDTEGSRRIHNEQVSSAEVQSFQQNRRDRAEAAYNNAIREGFRELYASHSNSSPLSSASSLPYRIDNIPERDARLRQLSLQLTPLLDRFGRVLTDTAPHMQQLSGEEPEPSTTASRNPTVTEQLTRGAGSSLHSFEANLMNLLNRPPPPTPQRAFRSTIRTQIVQNNNPISSRPGPAGSSVPAGISMSTGRPRIVQLAATSAGGAGPGIANNAPTPPGQTAAEMQERLRVINQDIAMLSLLQAFGITPTGVPDGGAQQAAQVQPSQQAAPVQPSVNANSASDSASTGASAITRRSLPAAINASRNIVNLSSVQQTIPVSTSAAPPASAVAAEADGSEAVAEVSEEHAAMRALATRASQLQAQVQDIAARSAELSQRTTAATAYSNQLNDIIRNLSTVEEIRDSRRRINEITAQIEAIRARNLGAAPETSTAVSTATAVAEATTSSMGSTVSMGGNAPGVSATVDNLDDSQHQPRSRVSSDEPPPLIPLSGVSSSDEDDDYQDDDDEEDEEEEDSSADECYNENDISMDDVDYGDFTVHSLAASAGGGPEHSGDETANNMIDSHNHNDRHDGVPQVLNNNYMSSETEHNLMDGLNDLLDMLPEPADVEGQNEQAHEDDNDEEDDEPAGLLDDLLPHGIVHTTLRDLTPSASAVTGAEATVDTGGSSNGGSSSRINMNIDRMNQSIVQNLQYYNPSLIVSSTVADSNHVSAPAVVSDAPNPLATSKVGSHTQHQMEPSEINHSVETSHEDVVPAAIVASTDINNSGNNSGSSNGDCATSGNISAGVGETPTAAATEAATEAAADATARGGSFFSRMRSFF